jgi:hypothetical protein
MWSFEIWRYYYPVSGLVILGILPWLGRVWDRFWDYSVMWVLVFPSFGFGSEMHFWVCWDMGIHFNRSCHAFLQCPLACQVKWEPSITMRPWFNDYWIQDLEVFMRAFVLHRKEQCQFGWNGFSKCELKFPWSGCNYRGLGLKCPQKFQISGFWGFGIAEYWATNNGSKIQLLGGKVPCICDENYQWANSLTDAWFEILWGPEYFTK